MQSTRHVLNLDRKRLEPSSPIYRRVPGLLLAVAALTWCPWARATESKGITAAWVGALTHAAALAVGASLVGASSQEPGLRRAGWLIAQTGFTVAPFAAHAAAGEWSRGALFAAAPGACLGATAGLIAGEPDFVARSALPQQRLLWVLFGASLATSVVGVVDATRADARRVSVMPMVSGRAAGVLVEGQF